MSKDFKVDVIVEIPYGSVWKYEIDKGDPTSLVVDRPLNDPIPYSYGFIPNTLCEDGDALDVCILNQKPIVPLSKVKVKILGAFLCTDNGVSDHKLFGIVVGTNLEQNDLIDKKMNARFYLENYKKSFRLDKSVDSDEAYKIYEKAHYKFQGIDDL